MGKANVVGAFEKAEVSFSFGAQAAEGGSTPATFAEGRLPEQKLGRADALHKTWRCGPVAEGSSEKKHSSNNARSPRTADVEAFAPLVLIAGQRRHARSALGPRGTSPAAGRPRYLGLKLSTGIASA